MGCCSSKGKTDHEEEYGVPKPLAEEATFAPVARHSPSKGGRTVPSPGKQDLISNTDDESMEPASAKEHGHGVFIRKKPGKVDAAYDFDPEPIGSGGYGKVYRVVDRLTQSVRAAKSVSKTQNGLPHVESFRQEISIMKLFNHPNIVKLFETFEDKSHIHLIMELCLGGCVMDHIKKSPGQKLSERCAQILMQQVFYATKYMHSLCICHRDLKPENFLLLTYDPMERNIVKIADFGLARRFEGDEQMTTKAGTVHYSSPELHTGRYDKATDLWSCGVIMFLMLSGKLPFDGAREVEIIAKIRKGNYSFSGESWDDVSEDGKNLIRKLLKFDRRERCTAEEAMVHIGNITRVVEGPVDAQFGAQTIGAMVLSLADQIRYFHCQNSLQRVARHVIAQRLDESQVREIQDAFKGLDTDNNSFLTKAQLLNGLQNAGVTPTREVEAIFQEACPMDYTEFLAMTLDLNFYLDGATCEAAFIALDQDGDHLITQHDLEELLGSNNSTNSTLRSALVEVLQDLPKYNRGIDYALFQRTLQDTESTSSRL